MTVSLPKYKMYVDSEFIEHASKDYIPSDNPFTGKPWCLIPQGTSEDTNRAVNAAQTAFKSGQWPRLNNSQRGELLRNLADLMQQNASQLGEIEVRDNGKLFVEMKAQVIYAASILRYYAGLADKIEGAVIPSDKDALIYTLYEPLGVCAAIVPWNSPIICAVFKIAPALSAGNTVIIKPSEYTSASILELMKLVEKAGFPKGVINVVTGFGKDVGAALVAHPLVKKLSFTGSSQTGAAIYSDAAKSIKHVGLELGGKSPNIVFADANLDNAIKGAVAGIYAASGQTCIAGSRLLVQSSIHDDFVERLIKFAQHASMGDPMDITTNIGPVTNPPQLEKIFKYIDIAKGEGAKVVIGGGKATRPECGDGWFVEPTIFTGVDNNMRIAQEEVFGPVLSVIPFEDEENALEIANDVEFGLAAGLWTENIRRAVKLSAQLEAGTVWVNTYRAVSYTTPFGGYKKSGIGRELGQNAIFEYLQTKSVWISTADEISNPFVFG